MSERPRQEKPPDAAIVLNYIDKLYEAFKRLVTRLQRYEVVKAVLSLLLLALSAGAASTTGAMTFGGFGLRVPLAVLLTGVAVFVGIVFVAQAVLRITAEHLTDLIRQQYKNIGYDDKEASEDVYAPFYSETLITAIQSSGMGNVWAAVSIYISDTILPVAAIIATGLKVAELLYARGLGWVWVLFVLLAIVVGVARASVYIRGGSLVKDWEDRGWPGELAEFAVIALLGAGLGYFVARVLGSA